MTALRRRLVTSLPFNLYWFCFRKSEIERLPQFLLNHPDVYFVAPNEQSADGSETSNSKHPDPVLSAVEVLDSFIEQLDVETPRLTRNPLEFFADQLRHSLPKEDTGAGNDIYSLRSVVQRVERANERHIATTLTIERQMEDVREALRRASYDEAAAKASEISSEDLPEDQLTELLGTMETVVRKMSADSPAKASACDVILGCYSLLRKRKLSQDNHAQIAAYATNVKANAFYAAKRYAEAIEIYDAALSQFGDFANSAIQDALGHVRNNKGLSLRNLDRNEEAIAMHEEVIKRFSGTEDNQRLNILTLAHLYKAHAFTNLNRNEEALREFDAADETINRIKDLLDYAKTAIDLSKPVRSKAAAAVVVTPAEQQQTETDLVSTSDDE